MKAKAFGYGGLTVLSPFPLPGLSPAEAAPEAAGAAELIRLTEGGPWEARERRPAFAWRGRFGLKLYAAGNDWIFTVGTGAEFAVDVAGERIACRLAPGGWSEATGEAFVRRILPRVVQLRGRIVLHAAALVAPIGVVLLCGVSGAGKSTLAASLNQRLGWGLLSDDVAILRVAAGSATVLPGSGELSLWEASHAGLGAAFARVERLAVYGTKLRCQLAPAPGTEGHPLAAIYFLDTDGSDADPGVTVEAVDLTASARRLESHAFRFNPADHVAAARRFSALVRLAPAVRSRSLYYPRRFERLPEVVARLAGECGGARDGAPS